MERFSHAEIEINTQCDCKCFACDRFLDVSQDAPMSLDQIKYFISESVELDWPWERFHILGGEPTLHPQLREIIECLVKYKQDHRPKMILRVISNGLGNLSKHRKWILERGVEVNVEGKSRTSDPNWFRNIRMAPIDDPNYRGQTEFPACSIFGIKACGIGVTRRGFYLCGAGAGVARMMGIPGVLHLKDLTYEAMLDQAKILCGICGHWNSGERSYNLVKLTGKRSSPTWEKLIKDHLQGGQATLPLYGAD